MINKKIALFLVLVLAITVISGCVQETVHDVTNEEEAGEVTEDMVDAIDDLAGQLSDIDDDMTE